jgi:starch phosphorylase
LNEGHSAFQLIERLGQEVRAGKSFDEARKTIQGNSVFTIHTPVPAGNEVFQADLVQRFAAPIFAEHGLDARKILSLGLGVTKDDTAFDMTAYCLNMAQHCNGVSQLHGRTAHGTWHSITGRDIIGVTNGVHMDTWLGRPIQALFEKHGLSSPELDMHATDLNAVQKHIDERVASIPSAELWQTHLQQKQDSAVVITRRLRNQMARNGADPFTMASGLAHFRSDVLTIGFARRFATYKRASLLFTDPKRLAAILDHQKHPVQLLFAGKAHPADKPGQALIQDIITKMHKFNLHHRIFFVEDYDMETGRALVQGVDVWLNNPRRPLEASGTSGMKAEANAVPNISILDGWWDEGFNGTNGWAIGNRQVLENEALQDKNDAQSLYNLLEGDVTTKFYARSGTQSFSEDWIRIMRDSIRTSVFAFSTTRMLSDYVTSMYHPAAGFKD